MRNIVKILIATVGFALIFTACKKEAALPYYKAGNVSVLTSSATTVTAAIADSSKTALSLNWTWPNYATDSLHQKFIIQIDSVGKNFAKPVTRVLKGVLSSSFTSKELNTIVFGFGDVSAPYALEMRILSSYANNNEQYLSNVVNVVVTPYIIPVTLSLNPTGPLTLEMSNGANNAVTFNWNATVFGNLPLNYAVQIDKAGGTFATPLVVTYGTALTGGINVTTLNRAAINAGIAANTTGDLAIRVVAYQGTNFTNPTYSNVAALKVTTYLDVVKFWIVGGYNGWDNSDNALFIMNTPATGANAEGYINFESSGEFKLTTGHGWDDAHTFGDDGTSTGKLSNAGGGHNISVPTAGYYLIKANPLTMTYSLTKTNWGIMGDYNGWASQTDMVYNTVSKTFSLALHLTSGGGFKFRGTSDWSINYGSVGANGILDTKDNNNISVKATGDYALTLDLSHPNAYTYSANTWGLVGAFTNWSGDPDVDMTWDSVNHVFTATANISAAGEWKFRANHDWGVNFGGSLDALTQDGGNLNFSSPGIYKVTLDPWARKATVTKN